VERAGRAPPRTRPGVVAQGVSGGGDGSVDGAVWDPFRQSKTLIGRKGVGATAESAGPGWLRVCVRKHRQASRHHKPTEKQPPQASNGR